MDYPIIFSAPMVRALLDGRKTQTRRLGWLSDKKAGADYVEKAPPSPWQKVKAGDRLWVRENIGRKIATSLFGTPVTNGVEDSFYAADDEEVVNEHGFNLCPWWKSAGTLPCIHMPRWASRLTLVVTETKVERLADLSERDAIAEGLEQREDWCPQYRGAPDLPWVSEFPRDAFADLWRSLHGPKSWEEPPEVRAITFADHKMNIDQKKAAA